MKTKFYNELSTWKIGKKYVIRGFNSSDYIRLELVAVTKYNLIFSKDTSKGYKDFEPILNIYKVNNNPDLLKANKKDVNQEDYS